MKLQAGRALDVLVAEIVMRWEPYSGGYYYGINGRILACVGREDGYIGELDERWSPSTDINTAWQIVEYMRQSGWFFELDDYANPLAICKAALMMMKLHDGSLEWR